MNIYTLDELKEHDIKLHNEITKTFDLMCSRVASDIIDMGTGITVHLTFVRLQNDNDDKIIHVRIRSMFAVKSIQELFMEIKGRVMDVTVFDSFEQYEQVRNETKDRDGAYEEGMKFTVRDFDGLPLN